MKNDQSRAFLAIVLSGIILFGWQFFFGPKQTQPISNQASTQKQQVDQSSSLDQAKNEMNVSDQVAGEQVSIPAESFTLNTEKSSMTIDSNLKIGHMENLSSVYKFEDTVEEEFPFEVFVNSNNGYQKIEFKLTKLNDTIQGTTSDGKISFWGKLNEFGSLEYRLTSTSPLSYQFKLKSVKKSENNKVREFIYLDKKAQRIQVGAAKETEGKLNWFGLDYNYHLFAITFDEKIYSRVQTFEDGRMLVALGAPRNVVSGKVIYTKKNYDDLKKLGNNLDLAVDFGFFGILAVPMLRAMQFFYRLIPNWGLAIILLTITLRVLTFPLTYSSFKSMKKMQVVQPELAKLKEKFKDDPQRMQKESMELFKRAGANPLGGCLPMLLQIPFFFAFYKVLYSAVELVGAPFIFWIKDLSIKDPYYILPVLMTIAFFLNQKITPATTADPTQKKIMMFMPLMFGVMMVNLPAGLTLYIFVSTLFGMFQQLFVTKRVST